MVIDEGSFKPRGSKPIEYEINDGCWISTSHQNTNTKGYVRIRRSSFKSSKMLLHRYIYLIHNGELPEDKVVMHTCDNRLCINPEHLRIGTQRDNVMDMISKGREKGCLKRSRLTKEEIVSIREDTRTNSMIAEDYGISPSYVSRIKSRRRL